MGHGASTMTTVARRSAPRSRVGGRLGSAKNSGIATVRHATDDYHAGMGILIDKRRVITCAHVVNAALALDVDSKNYPDAESRVVVRFPLVDGQPEIEAEIAHWLAPGMSPRDDIALLTLKEDAPEEAGIAILADIAAIPLDADRLSVFGRSESGPSGDYWIGNNVDAKFMGSTTAAWIQIDSIDRAGAFVEPGFSGAAVWDATHQVSVGMVVAKLISETERIAYMIPAYDLAAEIPELTIERRNLSSTFSPAWTILSAVMFILVFAHFAVERGLTNLQALSLGGENSVLSGFWGMHIVAVLLSVLMLQLFRFSTAFRQHKWWHKVPAFGRFSLVPQPSSRALSAVASIVFFVVLPFAAQAHFFWQFQDGDGRVIVKPSEFNCPAKEFADRGMTCDENGEFCWFRPMDVLLVKACKGDAPYRDTAYRFGDSPAPGHWVAYYPILQPLTIYLLTAIASVLALLALSNVFFGPSVRLWRIFGAFRDDILGVVRFSRDL